MINTLSRYWPLILIGLVGVIFWAGIIGPANVSADEPDPAFRILNIKAEYGHVVFEVEHMNPDGSHAYWENYTVQGVEWFKKDYVRDNQGRVLLASGEPAPRAMSLDRSFDYPYLPAGAEYKQSTTPMVDLTGVINAATRIHTERLNTDWDHGAQRVNTMPLNTIGPDIETDDGYVENSDNAGASALAEWFQPYLGQTYSVIDGEPQLYLAHIALPDMSVGNETGTIGLFYPESPGGDGYAISSTDGAGVGVPWATLRAASGTGGNNNANHFSANVINGTTSSYYYYMARSFVTFATASLPDSAIISGATIGIVGMSSNNTAGGLAIGWTDATTTSPQSVGAGTFGEFLDNRQAPDIALSSITVGSDGSYTNWTLNSSPGLTYINKTDVTKYAMRLSSDISNSAPSWVSGVYAGALTAYSQQEDGAGDNRPTLSVTYAAPTAAITGTIGDGATEQEVRDGEGTVLITLSDTTWVAAGATFDAQRQNIIDGLDAADAQTNGWNAEVRDKIGVGSVIRTSDTLVTITLAADEVSDYRIATNETITATVPTTATASGVALTAVPTFTIIGSVESAAVSGTLGGSGGTSAEIIAGGETVIITLANTTWVTAGATFNAQRQNILDGLVADDSDVYGWNAMAFAVGDVVRTSGTIVTITLSAESGYAIPSAETVTTTVPATAIVYGASLVAPETFTISPAAFATSGTRVSTAINLSGVTDLAYCAIGWETTLPTNTAVAIETSINGGSTYSTATNGNCPTGLTLGESLSTITDFRVKATLTTTDTSATPLITALGLIVEDAGGSELCYQLLTTPSASLADNCGTYTGTMSYPIGPSTITNTTAPITSTADPLPNARSLAGQDVAQGVTGSATSARLFPAAGDEGGFTGLPLNDLVNDMSTVGDGLPVRFVWFIFLGIATIGAGILAVHLTSNLFIAAGAMAAVMGFQMAIGSTGLLPGWILFAFIPLAGSFLLFRRGFPV